MTFQFPGTFWYYSLIQRFLVKKTEKFKWVVFKLALNNYQAFTDSFIILNMTRAYDKTLLQKNENL